MTSPGVRDHSTRSAYDQPGSQGPHSQLCWWPAQESGTTQPALLKTSPGSGTTQPVLLMTSPGSGTTQPVLLRTSLGVREHTASSAEDQTGSQGPHSQLCWWPAQESRTTQPALLMTSPGVRDHTTSSTDDQPGSQGPHSQLCWWPA